MATIAGSGLSLKGAAWCRSFLFGVGFLFEVGVGKVVYKINGEGG